MKILIDVSHPARFHFFKNFIVKMESRGHDIMITASEKDVLLDLLKFHGFQYSVLGKYGNTLLEKIINLPIMDYKLYKELRIFKPDILIGGIRAAHLSILLDKPCIAFFDDDYLVGMLTPFIDNAVLFSGVKKKSKKFIKINSYKEIAYLNPNYFSPDSSEEMMEKYGIAKDFFLVRFVGWYAYHDVNKKGFDEASKLRLIETLEKYGEVYISSEMPLPKKLMHKELPVPKHKLHDLIFNAKLLVSDSQTMTTEAAVLGTPAVRCNSFVGENDMMNFIELERDYGLIFNFSDPEEAIEKAVELIKTDGLKEEWAKRRQRLLDDKLDVTEFMVWFVENYPDSFDQMKRQHA